MGRIDLKLVLADGEALVRAGANPDGFDPATQTELDAHLTDAVDAHDASAISILDSANDFTATDVEGALAELQSDHEADSTALSDHIADTTAAHAASAISADSTTLVGTGTTVQAVFEELDNAIVADETALANHLADTVDAHDASAISNVAAGSIAATDVQAAINELDTEKVAKATFPVVIQIVVGDETTAITAGTAKVTQRSPFAFTLTGVRASLTTASSSGNPAVDINESGVSVLSTTLTIDANEKTSTTAAVPAVISDSAIADDAEMTIDIDVAGTGAAGLKVTLIGTRAV